MTLLSADAETFANLFLIKFLTIGQIIGCGQSSHGSHENFEIQKLIFEHLVQKKGCRIFIIEGCYSSVYNINEYVRDGIGIKDSVLKNLGFKVWYTEELWELIEWSKNFNIGRPTNDKILFLGNDMQCIKSTAKATLGFFTLYILRF